MTIHEASERYNIPLAVLQEYERWGLYDDGDRQRGARQYDEKDLERLSLIMTLRTIGFEGPQVEAYMQLREQEGTEGRRLRMLEEKRWSLLDDIHCRENRLQQLDGLRHCLRKQLEAMGIASR